MLPAKDWINLPEIKEIKEQPTSKLVGYSLNRDPNRAIYYDRDSFYSPADGFLLYSKVCLPTEKVIDVKGETYTINSLLRLELVEPCLIIGIFMTVLDVHINRIPTDGFVRYEKLGELKVVNLSMREVERNLLEELGINYNQMKYALYNERVRNRIFCPQIDQPYYLLQIADFEVDVIVHFDQQGKFYSQGERFSLVRMGSQVDLIIPFHNKKVTFNSLINNNLLYHVEGGVDKIVSVT
jgi:phosphatidylserine decarboxylase